MEFKGHLGQPLSRPACSPLSRRLPWPLTHPGVPAYSLLPTPYSDLRLPLTWPCYNSSTSGPVSLVSDSLPAKQPPPQEHTCGSESRGSLVQRRLWAPGDDVGHARCGCILQRVTINWELKSSPPGKSFAYSPSFSVELCIDTLTSASSWLDHFSAVVFPCSSSRGLIRVFFLIVDPHL